MAHPPKPGDLQDEGVDPLDPSPASAEDHDDFELPPGASPEEAGRIRGVTDMFRKAMVAGLGAVFMTEEGLRTMVKDLKLPKDVVGYIVGQAERSKDELFRVISDELRRFFESAALRRELSKVLSDVTIEIKAEIRVRPDGQSPEVKVDTATARRSKKGS